MVAKKKPATPAATTADRPASHSAEPAGRRSTAKKTAAKKTAAKKTAAKKTAAKKTAAKKTAAKKTAAKKEPAEKTTTARAGRPPAKTTAVGKAAAKKTTAKKAAAKKTTAKKTTAKKTGARTVTPKKTQAAGAAPVPAARVAEPHELPVRPGEDPWTAREVEEARSGLRTASNELREEIASADETLTGLMRDSSDGAGEDDADTGSRNITREHELSLAANAREMLYQTERALERLDAGTYGLCENCGRPIGKARMQAFPRATLCVECKQRQERR
jgi:RNA polymerase-binding protein DksA